MPLGIGHHKNLIVPMTFFFSGTINSIGPCNLFPKYCTMAFLVFIMNGLWMRKWLKQSLHYLTNVFNWIGRRECVSRWRRALMFCLIIQYCKWDCFGQRKIFDALLYVNVFHPCPPPPLPPPPPPSSTLSFSSFLWLSASRLMKVEVELYFSATEFTKAICRKGSLWLH